MNEILMLVLDVMFPFCYLEGERVLFIYDCVEGYIVLDRVFTKPAS